MRCSKCPLFSSWNNESDRGEACGIFGEDWGNRFQYENKEGTEIVGCYIEKAYIDKVERKRCEYYDRLAEGCIEQLFNELDEQISPFDEKEVMA